MQALLDLIFAVEGSVSEAAKFLGYVLLYMIVSSSGDARIFLFRGRTNKTIYLEIKFQNPKMLESIIFEIVNSYNVNRSFIFSV